MGEIPPWYPFFVAADRLHVPVWTLVSLDYRPIWVQWALIATQAENAARNGPKVTQFDSTPL